MDCGHDQISEKETKAWPTTMSKVFGKESPACQPNENIQLPAVVANWFLDRRAARTFLQGFNDAPILEFQTQFESIAKAHCGPSLMPPAERRGRPVIAPKVRANTTAYWSKTHYTEKMLDKDVNNSADSLHIFQPRGLPKDKKVPCVPL